MSVNTRDKILDAAESLFAQQGFHPTTLRQITRSAGVNLAAVNYHFGAKQTLIHAVFRRRLDALNAARLEQLSSIEREHDNPSLEDVLNAFVEPALAFSQGGDAEAQRFMQLLLRAFADRDVVLHQALSHDYAHIMQRFARAIADALPAADPERLRHQLDFIVGALTLTMAESALNETRVIAAELVQFAAAGLRGCGTKQPSTRTHSTTEVTA